MSQFCILSLISLCSCFFADRVVSPRYHQRFELRSNVYFPRLWAEVVFGRAAGREGGPWQPQCHLTPDINCWPRPRPRCGAPRCGSRCFATCGTSRLSEWARHSTPHVASTEMKRFASNPVDRRTLWSVDWLEKKFWFKKWTNPYNAFTVWHHFKQWSSTFGSWQAINWAGLKFS